MKSPGQLINAIQRKPQPIPSDNELSARRKGQDLWFRRILFLAVMALMLSEVACMASVIVLQGFGGWWWNEKWYEFDLDPWVLASFEAGILIQTFALASIITKPLFPHSN